MQTNQDVFSPIELAQIELLAASMTVNLRSKGTTTASRQDRLIGAQSALEWAMLDEATNGRMVR